VNAVATYQKGPDFLTARAMRYKYNFRFDF